MAVMLLCSYADVIYTNQAVKDIEASYDALIYLLESIERFLDRLGIYTKIPPTTAMVKVLVKIIVELLSTLGLVTKQMKQKWTSEFVVC